MLENLLSIDGFIIVNKTLCKKIGLNASAIIGVLYSEYNFWKSQNKLTDDGFFYCTRDKIESIIGLSAHEQRTAIKKLVELNIVETKLIGIPATSHYKINEQELLSILSDEQDTKDINNKMLKNLTSSSEEIKQLDTKNFNTNNNIYNNNKNNNKDYNKCVQITNSKKSKISKKDKILKMIEKKCLEFDIEDEVIDKLFEFYNVLLDNNKLVSEQKVNADLSNLAKVNYNKQLQTINEALNRGWTTLNPEWLDNIGTGKQAKNTLIHHEQKIAKNKGGIIV